jgi:hypothetical protein
MNIFGTRRTDRRSANSPPDLHDAHASGPHGGWRVVAPRPTIAGTPQTAGCPMPAATGAGRRAGGAGLRFPMIMLLVFLATLQLQANGMPWTSASVVGDCEISDQAPPAAEGRP